MKKFDQQKPNDGGLTLLHSERPKWYCLSVCSRVKSSFGGISFYRKNEGAFINNMFKDFLVLIYQLMD